MKFSLTSLLATLALFGLFAQSTSSVEYTLDDMAGKPTGGDPLSKMPCASSNTLMFLNVEFETEANGDNDASNNAFMTWEATGSATGLYYNQIVAEDGSFSTGIQMGNSGVTVFPGDDVTNNMDINVLFGGNTTNGCLEAGSYVIRVWEVMDSNNNGLPDRVGDNDNDMDAEIIGCYVESLAQVFQPSCPPNDPSRFSPVIIQPGCTNGGRGSITLNFDFNENVLYCVDSDGDGATIAWSGPGGFTSSATEISDLLPGTYSVEIRDFYGCLSTFSATIGDLQELEIECPGTFTPPSAPGAGDGSADITITAGSGNYTISWTGPTTGSEQGFDGVNTIMGLVGPGDYTFTVRDNSTNCTEECTVTPPCAIEFTAIRDETTGDITITVINGFAPFDLYYRGPDGDEIVVTGIGNGGTVLDGINFPPGDYEFDLREAADFFCTFPVDLTVPEADCSDIIITENNIRQPTCAGGDGVIDLTLTGGDQTSFFWTGPGVDDETTTVLTGLGNGTYTLVISDARNCDIMGGPYVLAGPAPVDMTCGAVGETLAVLDNGKIGYAIDGGTAPFTLSYTATDPDGGALPAVTDAPTGAMDSLRNLAAGTYNLTITDANGCMANCTAEVTEPNCDLSPVCAPTDPVAAGGTGSVTLTFDGTPAWTVTITGPRDTTFVTIDPSVTITNLPEGDYALAVFNTEGCTGSCAYALTGPNCNLAFSQTSTGPTCVENADATIFLDISGAAPGLTIDWDNDALDGLDTLRGLAAGSYTVVVSDQTGCPVPAQTITITDPDPVTVDVMPTDFILCNGDLTAGVSTVVAGGTSPYTFAWSVDTFAAQATLSALAAGTYGVQVTDADDCSGSGMITITEPPLFSMSCMATGETAAGSSDGTILVGNAGATDVVTLTGDLGTFVLSAGVDTTFTGLTPGTYELTLTNANGCTDECTAIVSMGGCGIMASIDAVQPDCDTDTGSATAVATDANGTVSYSWSNGATTETITGLAPGDYAVTITDALGCPDNAEVTIAAFTNFPTISDLTLSNVCGDGCIMLSFVGMGEGDFALRFALRENGIQAGTQAVTRGISGPRTVEFCPDFFGLTDFENKVLTVIDITSDGNDCSRELNQVFPIEINIPATGTINPTTCTGGSFTYENEVFDADRLTGEVVLPGADVNGCDSTVTVNLGFYPESRGTLNASTCTGGSFTYENEVFDADRLTGEVILPGADVNGCDSVVTVVLDFVSAVRSSLDTVTCTGGSIVYRGELFDAARPAGEIVLPGASVNGCDSIIEVSLGFIPLSRSTLDTTTCTGGSISYFGEVFNMARPTGDVVFSGADVNGCDSVVTVVLDFVSAVRSTLDTITCTGGSITYRGEVFDAARPAGEIVLPGASVNGCDSIIEVSLGFFPLSRSTLDTATCTGGSISYFGEVFNTARPTGDVVLPGASMGGCDSVVTVVLGFIQNSTSTLDTLTCAGGSITYLGEVFDAARPTGEVVLPGASASGCDSVVRVTLGFFPMSTAVLDTLTCAGGSVTYFGETFNAARPGGEVILPGADRNGCDSTVVISLSFFAPAFSALDTVICGGTSLTFFGETFDASRLTGDVVVPTPAADGCDSTVTVNLGFFPQVAGVLDTTICADESFTFGGRTFSSAVTNELITLPIPSVNGCDSTVAVTVRILDRPVITISGGDGVVCADGVLNFQIMYEGAGMASIILSTAPTEPVRISAGVNDLSRIVVPGTTVSILMATVQGVPCDPVVSGSVEAKETDLAVDIRVMSGDGLFAVSCAEGDDGAVLAVTSGGQPPFSYAWNTGTQDASLQDLTVGTYAVVVTSGRGCTTQSDITLSAPDVLLASIAELPANCFDTLPALVIRDVQGGVEPYYYRTMTGEALLPVPVLPDTVVMPVGRTTFAIEDENGCVLARTFDLAGPPLSEITLTPGRVVIQQGDSVEIVLQTELNLTGFTLTGIRADGGLAEDPLFLTGDRFFVGPLESTTYLVSAADPAGCSAEASVRVIIDDFVPVYAPTAFSPNDDGINDLFRVYGKPVVRAFSNFSIYDRWGNLVFVLDGPIDPQDDNWGWDGQNAAGQVHESAVYIFTIDVTLMDGREVTIKSDMVLMK